MSLDIKTKESQTVDGVVEYEAVECRYCENDVPVDEVIIAYTPCDAAEKQRISGRSYLEVEYASDGSQTPFCPHCYESIFGPPPSPNYFRRLQEHCQHREWLFMCYLATHLLLFTFGIFGVVVVAEGVAG